MMSLLVTFACSLGLTQGVAEDVYSVQWEAASAAKPWLREVRVTPSAELKAAVEQLPPAGPMHGGVRIRVPRLPAAKAPATPRAKPAPDKSAAAKPSSAETETEGVIRVQLADGYGFTLSPALLRREPFVWLKDLGVFACAGGDFAARKVAIDELAAQVDAARKHPFRSASEQYFAWTGYDESRAKLTDQAYPFAYDHRRPPAPRTRDSLAAMPEASYQYFCDRIADVKHRRMFLGWPNVGQEFYVLSNGTIGVSSGSNAHTGHAPAQHFTVAFGAGQPPAFKEHGDTAVVQSIEDGYHLAPHTRWRQGDTDVEVTALAYPLAGEEVRTGNEPLSAFCRLERSTNGPLWLKIRPTHWVGPKLPLTDLGRARIENGRLLAAKRIVLAFDQATATVKVESVQDQEVLVKVTPQGRFADLVIPYVAVEDALVERALGLGFEGARTKMKQYWDARLARGAQVVAPDPVVVNQLKTLYARTLITADLDVDGNYALKTSPIVYDTVWLHATAYGIEGLARRGYFDEARQYLEMGFRYQGSRPGDADKTYSTWDGFFNVPPRYAVPLWLNYQGWFQWAAARYFLYSDDKAWLEAKLPALIKSLEWTRSQRRLTMTKNPDGSLPISYGWLPGGRVTDGSRGTGTFTDCVNWMGFDEVVKVLERIGHARTAEFRQEADDYRRCILRGMKSAIANRDPVRLNDGTFVPYVPAYLDSKGHERNWWYAAIVDGHIAAVPGTRVIPPGNPIEDWLLQHFEDNLAVMAPNLVDEGHYLGQGIGYLRRDQPQHAIYTFYSCLATQMARQTMTTYEHRSWGAGRVYELAPWPLYYFGEMLSGMLCYDQGEELVYGRATPKAWLDAGREIRVEGLQTRFGPTSFLLKGEKDRVTGHVEPASRYRPAATKLRIRVNGRLTAVKLNGKPAELDASGAVVLPVGAGRIRVEAAVSR